MDDSAIMCDEAIDADAGAESNDEETKTFPTNFNEKKLAAKRNYILLAFSLTLRRWITDLRFSATVWFLQILGHFLLFWEAVSSSDCALNFE